MSNLHTKALVLVALMTLANTSATAQTITDLQKIRVDFWLKPAEICAQKRNDKNLTLTKRAEICQKSLAALKGRVKTDPTQSDYEANYYYYSLTLIHALIGGIYGEIDGARSTRLCTQIEYQWQMVGKIKPSAWTIKTNDIVLKSTNSVIPVVKKCRAEKGTPTWARPLP